ncbi:LysR family transcriptional regulator [Erwinia sp. 9145]|uniref:LysR family transcriptional regulator n=1 Tax=Erwinia sp. 9145 TaxID=1500895 RepID=UPI000550D017|nr:LysR family transcriptional regulator [Erwinia sp. 9145]
MNKLKAMEIFVRVAETGNLSAVARERNLTQPAVSQQIVALEQLLGTVLLFRTTRSVTLTEAGERYYHQIVPVLDALAETEDSLFTQRQQLTGTLRIQAPSGLGQKLITPVVIAFQQQHPGLIVELMLEDRLSDIVSEGIDLAIRLGKPVRQNQVIRQLGEVERVLVAAPAYLHGAGTPATLSTLADHRSVRYSGLAEGDALTLEGPDGKETVLLKTVFRANNSLSLITALEEGMGIGSIQKPLVAEHLQKGTLVHLLPQYRWAPLTLYALYPSGRFIPLKARMLTDALISSLENIDGIKPVSGWNVKRQ